MLFIADRLKSSIAAGFLLLTVAACGAPSAVFAECKEFTIVEYEDRVEAVCVGEPLTTAQKQAMAEEEKRQEQEYLRKKAEEDRRQRESDAAEARKVAQTEADRKKQEAMPVPKTQKPDGNRFNKFSPLKSL